jgi:hypothetical protein
MKTLLCRVCMGGVQSLLMTLAYMMAPPAANANIVARARGMHVNNGPNGDNNWLFCHNILFRGTRFNIFGSR